MQITQLQLLTNDLQKLKDFYGKVLQFKREDGHEGNITFQVGSSKLTFSTSSIERTFYHFAFNIPSNKFEEAFDWMKERVEILPINSSTKVADYPNWNAKSFYFYDPAGNIVECIARFSLENNSAQPFTASSITEISEIGIVVKDVYEETERLSKDYNIGLFARQPRLNNFAASGDDNGLFIIVNEEKMWYPTTQQVMRNEIVVCIQIGDRRFTITRLG